MKDDIFNTEKLTPTRIQHGVSRLGNIEIT